MRTYQLAMRGLGHINANIPCQDKTAVLIENGVTCIALSDGAGSALLSHFGAQSATEEITKILCMDFDTFYKSHNINDTNSVIIDKIHTKLKEVAEVQECTLSDLACTLLFVACKGDKYIAGQLGDGCLAYARGGICKLATKPEKGEFANSTYFITSQNSAKHLKLFKGEINDITGFMLMSDGAAESLYQRQDNKVAPLVFRLINDTFCKSQAWLRDIFDPFFEQNILARTQDDCSIAIINTCKTYRCLLDSLDDEKILKMFYKTKRIKNNYIEQYIDILLNIHQTSDMAVLSKMVNINQSVVKRRLQNMRKLGFGDVLKFFN